MPVEPGAVVAVRTLGRKRGVVIETRRGGRVLVRVEGATVWCRDEDLDVLAPERGGRARTPRLASGVPPRGGQPGHPTGATTRIDLHGRTVEDAMTRVIEEIDRALLAGADRLEVVHGKGSGRIRDALHRALASIPAVTAFRLDPKNSGVTWVFF